METKQLNGKAIYSPKDLDTAAAAICSALKDLDIEDAASVLADALRKDEERAILPFFMIYRMAQSINATKVEFIIDKDHSRVSFYNKDGKIDLSRLRKTKK